jgi:hypothetical protein
MLFPTCLDWSWASNCESPLRNGQPATGLESLGVRRLVAGNHQQEMLHHILRPRRRATATSHVKGCRMCGELSPRKSSSITVWRIIPLLSGALPLQAELVIQIGDLEACSSIKSGRSSLVEALEPRGETAIDQAEGVRTTISPPSFR